MMEEAWPWLIWSTFLGWMSPAVLFLLLNLVIGTIALTSKSLRSHLHRRDSGGAVHDPPELFAPPIARGPSAVLERVRSIGLFRFRSGDLPLDQAFLAREEEEGKEIPTSTSVAAGADTVQGGEPDHDEHQKHHYGRSRSDSGQPASQKLAGRMKKSASVSSAFSHFDVADMGGRRPWRGGGREVVMEEEEDEEGGEVDARADDFINRFRQQLKLQRLDSIMKYKEMLNRGK